MRGSNFCFFAALYSSCLGFNALLAFPTNCYKLLHRDKNWFPNSNDWLISTSYLRIGIASWSPPNIGASSRVLLSTPITSWGDPRQYMLFLEVHYQTVLSRIQNWDLTFCLYLNLKHSELDLSLAKKNHCTSISKRSSFKRPPWHFKMWQEGPIL